MSAPVNAATPGAGAAAAVADHLGRFTYRWTNEIELQQAIWDVLQSRFVADRERALSRRDRPDFIVDVDGVSVALEVKVAGARNAVLRQLGRYAEHDTVDAIVLASSRRVLAAGIPAAIHGKPVLAIYLGGLL
ncbi:hypothetical protein MTY66_63070 (plasmid) [Mycolicibacterium sp. TY66]|uniref:hypothetical protein n=1 Tax=unclassified Mycolicibacterium TaxID=2636767 RepID=UPI001BB3CCA1|nr:MULTISPECIES: hypothetical protein [unclassified Mycolicibacterium]BCI84682.1 hypothetical protein MTY66_63070 [Mycolicibacterium sp. TY66]BCJ84911.1 hypothetical protein MTY81_62840 [Mycolicibacterium sp. TY81]